MKAVILRLFSNCRLAHSLFKFDSIIFMKTPKLVNEVNFLHIHNIATAKNFGIIGVYR